jgi:release factor glutamine methyltransferase
VLGWDRARLILDAGQEFSPDLRDRYQAMIDRRRQHEPVDYILGWRWFRGVLLEVNRDVLIPRPETELLVELAIDRAQSRGGPTIADVGTGSGAIAIAVARDLPAARVVATDISRASLLVARRNRDRIAPGVDLVEADLLRGLRGPFDLIVANLPYIDEAILSGLQPSVRDWEPRVALDGGIGGLAVIGRLLSQSVARLGNSGSVVLEIAFDQGDRAVELARRAFPAAVIAVHHDLSGLPRAVTIDQS